MSRELKVLVADDTATFRAILKQVVDSFDNCTCIATAPNGKIAVRKVKDLKPDLVIMDIEMPQMDGVEALKEIQAFDSRVPVILVSGVNRENAEKVVKALAAGALDFITKPESRDGEQSTSELRRKLKPIIDMVEVRRIFKTTGEPGPKREKKEKPPAKPAPKRIRPSIRAIIGQYDFVLIATSTGGPNALKEVLPVLPADLGCPVLVVQHMPPTFTLSLSESLDKLSPLKVIEASEGDIPEAGTVYMAPGGRHMIMRRTYSRDKSHLELHLTDTPPVNSCRPAADVLFRSIARTVEGNFLVVILTGMGNDGSAGLRVLKEKGAYSILQDEDTSVVWGMPGEADRMGLGDEIIPLDKIGPRIARLVGRQ